MAEPKTSFTYVLTAEQQQILKDLLSGGNFRPCTVPHTQMAVEGSGCHINLYNSGKCLIQGKGAEDFVLFYLEPFVLQKAELGYDDILKPEAVAPHMGIDESGKGDFFGPLVAAAAYVNADLAKAMQEAGVKDCKLLNDKQTLAIGNKLKNMLGRNRYALVMIGPEAYNRLYAKFHNVNSLLGWAHARCIENLLETVSDCPRAVADQFGSEAVIKRALMQKGRAIKLEQRHKAESDIAVAAASILARDAFLRALLKIGEATQLNIPKGASQQVTEAAVAMVNKLGVESLIRNVKCHFRTTDAVLAACGKTRSDLPAEGQVVSRSLEGGGNFKRRKSTTTTTAASEKA